MRDAIEQGSRHQVALVAAVIAFVVALVVVSVISYSPPPLPPANEDAVSLGDAGAGGDLEGTVEAAEDAKSDD